MGAPPQPVESLLKIVHQIANRIKHIYKQTYRKPQAGEHAEVDRHTGDHADIEQADPPSR